MSDKESKTPFTDEVETRASYDGPLGANFKDRYICRYALVEQTKRQADALERIAAAVEKWWRPTEKLAPDEIRVSPFNFAPQKKE